jgi:hypothetical protein
MIALVLRNPHWLKEQSEHFSKAHLMIEKGLSGSYKIV